MSFESLIGSILDISDEIPATDLKHVMRRIGRSFENFEPPPPPPTLSLSRRKNTVAEPLLSTFLKPLVR